MIDGSVQIPDVIKSFLKLTVGRLKHNTQTRARTHTHTLLPLSHNHNFDLI